MTIEFHDAVNGDGLFDLLGKVFHCEQVINDARGTDFPTALTAILTQAENFPDSIDFSLALNGVPGIADTAENSLTSAMTQLAAAASQIVVEVVNADNPLPSATLAAAMAELIQQMQDNTETVDASTVAVSVAPDGSPAGDGVFVLSKKRGDGLVAENVIGETLAILCASDGPNASLRITADAATSGKLASAWPDGSGANTATTSIELTRSLLKNPGFDTDVLYTNQPDDWILSVGTRGTTVMMTTIEQQTIAIAGTPTGGYYLLHWTNADGETQTTVPLAYNAGGSTVQAALRALKGLEGVTVTATGTSPNYTHTIVFKGHGGNVGQLTSTNRMTGAASVNEKQRITITGDPDGGTFTLTYSGQTTAGIDFDATAAEIEAALEALSNLDTMTGTGGPMPNSTADMEFGGSLAGTDVAAMTISTAGLTKTAPTVTVTTTTAGGAGGVNEVQTITASGTPNGGTWTITWSGQTTAAIAANANAAAVQAALEALSNIAAGEVAVTGGALGTAAFSVTFQNGLGSANQPAMTVDESSLLGPNVTVSIATLTPGSPSQDEVQEFQLYGTPTGGTFTLTFDGQTSSALAYNASTSDIDTALEALSNIGAGDITIGGGPLPGSAVTVTFGTSLAQTNVPELIVNGASLTGGSISVTMSTPTSGSTGLQDKLDDFWKFNDSPSGNADSVGANTLTAYSGASSVSGKISNAVSFTNSTLGGAKTNPTGSIATVNHDFTVFGWIKLQSVAAAGGAIVGVRDTSGGFLWKLDVASSKARASIRTTGGGGVTITVSDTTFGNLSDNTWYFVAMRWNESTRTLSISVNAGTPVEVVGASGGTTIAVKYVTFGYLTGTPTVVDEFGYCGELLSDAEITELYNSGTGQTTPLSSSTNEVQRVTIAGSPGQGSFTVTFDGVTSDPIPYDSTAGEVEAILEAMSSIGTGNVSCTGGALPGTAVDIEFVGDLAAMNVAAMTADDNLLKVSITTTTQGDPGTDEQQLISASPTPVAGTFTLTFDGQTTSALDYDATASEVDAALEALSNIGAGDITVTGGPLNVANLTVTFTNALGDTNVAEMTATSSLTGASPTDLTVATTTEGVSPSNETQSFTLGPDVTGGTYTLTWHNGTSSQTTAAIAWNASFDDVRAALEATSTIAPGDVSVAGGPSPAAVTVTFQGAYAGQNVNAMTGSGAGLTQDAIAGTITTIQDGAPDSGSITHVTTVPGTPQVYTGDKALILASNGTELTTFHQRLTTLKATTPYAFCLWACHDGNAIASGVITIDLVDGVSGTVIQDDQGVANSLTFNASDLTSSFQPLTELVSGECVFRTPTVLPDIIYLRLRISTVIPNGKKVFLDHLLLTPLAELYRGGPWIACIAGAERFRVGDAYTLTVTNDRAGLLQEWFERNFGMSTLGLLLPSNSAGGETIPDSVVS